MSVSMTAFDESLHIAYDNDDDDDDHHHCRHRRQAHYTIAYSGEFNSYSGSLFG